MKKIGITQREEVLSSMNEVRDALDQRWMDLFSACGIEPVVLPNHLPTIRKYLAKQVLDGLILSGGNDIGTAPGRDAVEKELLNWASKKKSAAYGCMPRDANASPLFWGKPSAYFKPC